jgi:hypothetical protein
MKPMDDNELEQRISQWARQLPPRKAPRSLEMRVLAAIAAREALPWWRKSFAHWPAAIRVVFLGVTAALAAGTVWILLGAMGATSVEAAGEVFTAPLAWWHNLNAASRSLLDLVLRALPPSAMSWIYLSLGLVAAAYVALIGAGAAMYRVLRPNL